MKKENITVCIPTFKRPLLLERLLMSIKEQQTHGEFNVSVVVVDNDKECSARDTVRKFGKGRVCVCYENEPVQNISLARNRAVLRSRGEFVAFIDDDEFPQKYWLYNHYRMIKKTGADGVLGPVIPYYEPGAPDWLIKSRICVRPSYASGTLLKASQTRSGNVLFNRKVFTDTGLLFDPSYGLTGGEDVDFFRRAERCGLKFVWCQEASVFETVPAERWKRTYYVKRAMVRGRVKHFSYRSKNRTERYRALAKSIIAFSVYIFSFPVVITMGERIRMKVVDSCFHHAGMLSAALGLKILSRR
jgi:glycosyltransferase involved in cell wall biosynthesis